MEKNKNATLDMAELQQDRVEIAAGGTVSALERWLAQKLAELGGASAVDLVLWNGDEIKQREGKPVARVIIRDRGALFKLLVDPGLHFGDLYSVGRVEIEGDLVQFLEVAYRAVTDMSRRPLLKRVQALTQQRPRRNTLHGSRSNIHHHYDIGNDFYQLWLDREMQYTCAYFPDPAMTLEQAQLAKLEHVCRKLRLTRGERVVEAGCGWGGLARYMARQYGVRVRSYNISHEQIVYARAKAKAEGLDKLVEYVEDDYRNINGSYDAFVSVGMLEHVGPENYRELGEVVHRSLNPRGRGLIHSIGRNSPGLMNAWIEKRIFPGACPPSLMQMMDIFEPRGFSVLDVENLREHYVLTLRHWLARYESHAEHIERTFDETFVRAWRLYLAGSIAAFTTSSLQLFQVAFARPNVRDLPWNRAYLYR